MRSALKILLCAHQGSIIFNLAPFPVSSSFMFNMKLLWSVSSLVSFWGWQKHLPAVPVASQRSTQTCLKSLKVLSMHCIGKTLTLHCSALKVWCLCEIVHSKNKHFLKIVAGCFFIRTDFEKFRITSFAYQWILCSEWVPSEWEFKQLIKCLVKRKAVCL